MYLCVCLCIYIYIYFSTWIQAYFLFTKEKTFVANFKKSKEPPANIYIYICIYIYIIYIYIYIYIYLYIYYLKKDIWSH